jgi:hypothetical protein
MRRIVEFFALGGAAIPILLLLIGVLLGEFPQWLIGPMLYICPSLFFVEMGPGGIVGWIMAVIINVILYAFIGILIKYSWILISKWRKAEAS